MTVALLDTGVIVAWLDRRQVWHEACAEYVSNSDDRLVTCEAVITEACHLLKHIPSAVDAVLANVQVGNFILPLSAAEQASRVRKLLKRYANVPMDFADACLVDLADALQSGRILTLDSDFQIYRWGRRRPFDLLIDVK